VVLVKRKRLDGSMVAVMASSVVGQEIISSKAHDNLEITKRRMKLKYTGTMVQVHIGLVMTSKALSPGARL